MNRSNSRTLKAGIIGHEETKIYNSAASIIFKEHGSCPFYSTTVSQGNCACITASVCLAHGLRGYSSTESLRFPVKQINGPRRTPNGNT